MIRIKNIKIYEDFNKEELLKYILKKYKIDKKDVIDWSIYKKSVDARNKSDIHYVYTVDIELKNESKEKRFEKVEKYVFPKINVVRKSKKRPIIIGSGPAGLFAGIIMVQNGLKPIILEQGKCIEERVLDIEEFKKNRILNTLSNVQFGEGGAGTFSDGKLNTGNTSIYSRKVLEEFVKFGAPEEILYVSKPHIGTDNLVNVVKNIREYIKANGGDVYFDHKVIDFKFENDKINSLVCSNGAEFETDAVVLAIGHSSRDTIRRLYELGINMESKNFAIGVRIEHLQEMINKSQYGEQTKLNLPQSDYKLVYHAKNGRVAYTFCMCPGGIVMASSSNEESIVTNGMSVYARDGKNSNSALLVDVNTNDFDSNSPLGGIEFQEDIERKAFIFGGKNYNAPVQRVEDFMNNRNTIEFGKIYPTYEPGVTKTNLNEILPDFVSETLKEAIVELDKKLNGFADKDALLTGVETRTSSAVKILRDKESLMSNIYGLYPCGEGAGYAGGIMTSAIDGIKCAVKILEER